MTGGEDWTERFLAETRTRRAEEDEYLRDVAVRAHAEGKEPFDLDRFERLYDTTSALASEHVQPRHERDREWRWKYYVDFPDVRTLQEFAERLEAIEPYRDA